MKATCTAALPSLKLEPGSPAPSPLTVTDGSTSNTQGINACCYASPLCSTGFVAAGATDATKQACPTDTLLQSSNKCLTTAGTDTAKCAAADSTTRTNHATLWVTDKEICCKMPCSKKFQLKDGGDATKFECPAGDFQVSTSANCAGSTCTVSADQATCCQKKCAKAVVLFGEDTSVTGVDVACKSDTTDKISTTAFCTKSTCAATDTQCCQQKCGDGFVLHGTTDTGTSNSGKAKLTCGEGLFLNTDSKLGFCKKTQCASSDASTCCLTKCTATKGFELFGGKTDGKFQCAKDLRVHPTGNCKGTDCKSSSSVCCQQKCTAGFKLKGATGTGTECDKDLTVHATGYCKGSSCGSSDAGTCCQQSCSKGFKLNGASTKEANTCAKDSTLASDAKCAGSPCAGSDSKLCCNEKCVDKKTGFKVKGGTGKEPNECLAKETVASKAHCKGDCSSDDKDTCCLKENKSTATTDAHTTGLASVVAMLLLLSTAS